MLHSRHIAALCAVLAFSLGGAIQPCAGSERNVGEVNQPLTAFDLSTWTPWTVWPLNVCFKPNPDSPLSAPDFDKIKGWVFTGLEQTWGQVPGIDFTKSCAAASERLDIILQDDGRGVWGRCSWGVNSTCRVNGNVSVADAENEVKAAAVHEVGHALGMLHEHQRLGAAPLCPDEQAILTACNACIGAPPGVPPSCAPLPICAANDYNTCVRPETPVGTPGSGFTLTPEQCKGVQDAIGDRTEIPGAKRLTVEDLISIMSYCSKFHGRGSSLYNLALYMPTNYDLLGLEMLYPQQNTTYRIGCTNGTPGCFATADGAITRTDGTITSEWTARGGLDVLMRKGVWPGGGFGNYEPSLSVSNLPLGTSNFRYQFKAPRGQILYGGGKVTKSDSAYAAVLTSIFAATL